MPPQPDSFYEQNRLAALRSYQVLDTIEEKDFDELTALSAGIFHAPVSTITLIDEKRQWFKSHHGVENREDPIELSFCAQAIKNPEEVMVVEDAKQDERFKDNPLVTGNTNIGFYAGVPLVNNEGYALGTLCIIDHMPRKLSADQIMGLKALASQVMDKLELRKRMKELNEANLKLKAANEQLSAANEELSAALEELNSSNEEVTTTRADLQQLNAQLERRIAARTADLAASEYKIRSIIESAPFPIGVYTGREMRIAFANKTILDIWGKGYDVIDKLYTEILPELDSQEVFTQLAGVFDTGMPFRARNQRIDLFVEGGLKIFYFNYDFTPLYNEDGGMYGVMNTAADVTDVVLAKQRVEEASHEFASLNEELAATVEELASSNEELTATNEQLIDLQEQLKLQTDAKQTAIGSLEASEQNLRNMVRQAPVGMCIIEGDPLFVVEINDSFLEIIGKSRDELRLKPYWEVNAEAAPYYKPITDNVLATGITYHANEHRIMLIREGREEIVYVDFVYEPIKDSNGNAGAIMIVATDVTDKVLARKELEGAYEQARLSKEAAQMGTFDMDLEKGTLEWDNRCRTLFGISHHDTVTYEKDFVKGLHPQDKERIVEIIDNAFIKSVSNGNYDVEYRTIGAEDKKLRWVRAKGQVYFDNQEKPFRFIGSVLDITDKKQDEQRKNDFIGMVSHELKTPLTSMKAYIQLLYGKAKNTEDTFTISALDKTNNQVNKMTKMINGFLNVSRLEVGKIHIDMQRFDMAGLVKEAEEESMATVTSHHIIFAPVVETFVIADRDKISQVISNFISNAVKYSPGGTTIHVACITVGNTAQVSVRDEGTGIRPQDQEKIFERYYRVEGEQTKTVAGFGIGLYLCAEIIQRHNGRIWLESEVGKGSVFYFELPLS